MQTYGVLKELMTHHVHTYGLIMGGSNRSAEAQKLANGVNVLVATPGRLLDHLQVRRGRRMGERTSVIQWLLPGAEHPVELVKHFLNVPSEHPWIHVQEPAVFDHRWGRPDLGGGLWGRAEANHPAAAKYGSSFLLWLFKNIISMVALWRCDHEGALLYLFGLQPSSCMFHWQFFINVCREEADDAVLCNSDQKGWGSRSHLPEEGATLRWCWWW